MRHLTTNQMLSRNTLAQVAGVILIAAASFSPASAQMTDAEVYENVIKPQEESRAREVTDILARPSNWGPGEIRSNSNFGSIAWYKKSNGDYGYIVARGYISPTSANVQMSIECDSRRVTCEGNRVVANQWLAIGKRTDKLHYTTAAGQTRKEAEALVLQQCRQDGGTCIIQDVFDIMPHKRGMTNLRPKVQQR